MEDLGAGARLASITEGFPPNPNVSAEKGSFTKYHSATQSGGVASQRLPFKEGEIDMHRLVKRIGLLMVVASLFAGVVGGFGGFGTATANARAYCGGYTGADGDWHIKCYVF